MSHDTAWYRRKAQSLVVGWRRTFGTEPSLEQIVCPLASAIHETQAGDSWPGPDGSVGTQDDEHDWGATTLRSLNASELAVLSKAGIRPTVGAGHVKAAEDAMTALHASGLPQPQGVIHCDSRTVVGGGNVPYFVWFASFENDDDGAEFFCHALALKKGGEHRPAYAVLMAPGLTEYRLAAAMFAGGYYTGFHSAKDASPEARRAAAELNIADYAGSMKRIAAPLRIALQSWTPASSNKIELPTPALAPMLDLAHTWQDAVRAARDAEIQS